MANKKHILSCITICAMFAGCGGSSNKNNDEGIVNLAPVAQISVDKTQYLENERVTLSAKNSNDPEGGELSYQWQIQDENGVAITLENATSEEVTFTPAEFGNYTIELVVKDNASKTDSIETSIEVMPSVDDYPVANLTGKSKAKVGAVHWLSGEQSLGAHGEIIEFEWAISLKPNGSDATMQDASKVKSYFVADKPGDYQVKLTVSNILNGLTDSTTFDVNFTDLLDNSIPVAKVTREDRQFSLNEVITLDGSSSFDADNEQLTYQWHWVSKPTSSNSELVIASLETVNFNADVVGDYQVSLVVQDKESQDEEIITVTVTNDNIAPIAYAGEDKTIAYNTEFLIDASASYDKDGQPLQYEWSLVSRPVSSAYNELDNVYLRNDAKLRFKPDVTGLFTLKLRVFDGEVYSAADTITIDVIENAIPVAVLDDDVVVNNDLTVSIDGTKSFDEENQALTYRWQLIEAPEGFDQELTGAFGTASIRPTIVGRYTVQLIVNDGTHDSLPETKVIIREEEVMFYREVTGRLVDAAGKPISDVTIGGIFQIPVTSDDNGDFSITLASRAQDTRLNTLTLNSNDEIRAFIRLADGVDDMGDVTIPVMQRKDISIKTCQGYQGPEHINLHISQHKTGYENMSFLMPVRADITVNALPQQVMLPATSLLEIRVLGDALTIVDENGKSFVNHEYQIDDSQEDLLELTVCQ